MFLKSFMSSFSSKNSQTKNVLFSTALIPTTICHHRKFSSRREKAEEKVQKEIDESKKQLKWRYQPDEQPEAWKSKFQVFNDEGQNSDFISMMQQPIDLSPTSIKRWWKNRKEFVERNMQQYIPERHAILGSDLATAHFLVHRGGSVKFLRKPDWMRADENGQYILPAKYDPSWKIEAVRCDNMTLYYEGLENIRNLHNLKFWSLVNVKTFDDWCLDRVSGAQNPILEVLDLTGTNITYRGLHALYRIDSLKVLVVDNPQVSKEFELTCALLEEALPKLKVYAAKDIH